MGQKTPVSDRLSFSSILPSAIAASFVFSEVAEDNIKEYREILLQRLLDVGGGQRTDGITLQVQERQF